MKGLSVLFTIFLFLLAGKLSHQLKRAGALPARAETHAQPQAGASAASSESEAGAQPSFVNATFNAHANYN
jgi:hypothetical protein